MRAADTLSEQGGHFVRKTEQSTASVTDKGRTLWQEGRTLSANSLILWADTREADTLFGQLSAHAKASRISSLLLNGSEGRTKCPDSTSFPGGGHSLPSLEGSVPRRQEEEQHCSRVEIRPAEHGSGGGKPGAGGQPAEVRRRADRVLTGARRAAKREMRKRLSAMTGDPR
jgi:hypothetical protein